MNAVGRSCAPAARCLALCRLRRPKPPERRRSPHPARAGKPLLCARGLDLGVADSEGRAAAAIRGDGPADGGAGAGADPDGPGRAGRKLFRTGQRPYRPPLRRLGAGSGRARAARSVTAGSAIGLRTQPRPRSTSRALDADGAPGDPAPIARPPLVLLGDGLGAHDRHCARWAAACRSAGRCWTRRPSPRARCGRREPLGALGRGRGLNRARPSAGRGAPPSAPRSPGHDAPRPPLASRLDRRPIRACGLRGREPGAGSTAFNQVGGGRARSGGSARPVKPPVLMTGRARAAAWRRHRLHRPAPLQAHRLSGRPRPSPPRSRRRAQALAGRDGRLHRRPGAGRWPPRRRATRSTGSERPEALKMWVRLWRLSLRAAAASSSSQVVCTTRRSPAKGLWPCQELSERAKATRLP